MRPLAIVVVVVVVVVAVVVGSGCAGARADPAEGSDEVAVAAAAVLERHCARCHAGGGAWTAAQSDFDFVRDPARLVASGLVIAGEPARSPLWVRLDAGEMPPASVQVRPTAAERAAVRAWIERIAPAPRAARMTEAELERTVAADRARLAAADRPHARWISLAALASTGATEPQLARYRTAVAVLLASLSWSPVIRPPVAIDAARLVYRIDLRDLGWTDAMWEELRAAYPYGTARPAGVPDPVRADWLVATASRAPLYHTLLGIPERDTELARRLGIDLADDVARRRVARAGFTSSGVSQHNRVIERHATRYGALWRSYDFRSSRGREDVFAHPLGFTAAGGELIFSLPNGLQGYMLVDGAGRRIDKAPQAIVSDPRRPDRAVENAVSCIGCHAAGILERADEVRATAAALAPAERDAVEALYPPAVELSRLYAQDRARFASALAAAGAPVADPTTEPIGLLTARYEAELDETRAAAELGLTPGELAQRLARAPDLRRALGGLGSGGRVKREVWEQSFARALAELGAGIPAVAVRTAGAAPDEGARVWTDARRRRWLALDGRRDHAAAVAACRARRLELPRHDELVAAFAGGLGGGLGLADAVWTGGVQLDAANQRSAAAFDPVTGVARREALEARRAVVCVTP